MEDQADICMNDRIVQVQNPRSGRWVKINKDTGLIYTKNSKGGWKNIPKVKVNASI